MASYKSQIISSGGDTSVGSGKMILSHIVAMSENRVIGREGGLPWRIPEDTQFFKDKTKGHALIMGRRTFESVGHPLPHRLNIVVTNQKGYKAEGAVIVESLDEALAFCKTQIEKYGEEVFIIGGGEIYKQSLPIVDLIYLTLIHQDFEGDTYYPAFNPNEFEEIERRDRTEPVAYSFLTYARKSALKKT